MKRQPLSMLALASLLILSSCGQTAGVRDRRLRNKPRAKSSASSADRRRPDRIGQSGRISCKTVSIYIKVFPYAKAERFMPPAACRQMGRRAQQPHAYGPTCPQGGAYGLGCSDEHAFRLPLGRRLSRRRLPAGEHLDSGPERRQEASRHGVASRRRLCGRQRTGTSLLRRFQTLPRKVMRW